MLVLISWPSRARCAGEASSSIENAIFSRASGERSSWLALASRLLWERSSVSICSAARLKLVASAATSSLPLSCTRKLRSPEPNCSTPDFSDSSRRVSRRTTGYAPPATARNSTASNTASASPLGRGTQPGTQEAAFSSRRCCSSRSSMRWRIWSISVRPSRRPGSRSSGGGPSTKGSRRSRKTRRGPLAARASASSLSCPIGPEAPGGRARRRNSR